MAGERSGQRTATQRKGNVEVLRYLFAYVIAVEHFCLKLPGVVLPAVDFFFLAAGCFQMRRMARETSFSPGRYLWERFTGLAFFYEASILLLTLFPEQGGGIVSVLGGLYRSIPDMLCLQMSGLFELHVNPPLWFISAMLLASLALALLFSFSRRLFVHALPVIALLCYAGLFFLQGNMDAIYAPNFLNPQRYLIPLGTIRALGGLSLGCLVWLFYERCREGLQNKKYRMALSAAEILAAVLTLYGALFRHHTAYDFYYLLFLPVILVCALSQNTLWGGLTDRVGKALSAALGKQFTLAVFCLHIPVIQLGGPLLRRLAGGSETGAALLFVLLLTAVSFAFTKASESFKRFVDKKR
ncbi:MAG: acyltransferase family protein [Eubacteriales bacterium]|nr:acyltransferase family protein [Eubacteriales bacterium]